MCAQVGARNSVGGSRSRLRGGWIAKGTVRRPPSERIVWDLLQLCFPPPLFTTLFKKSSIFSQQLLHKSIRFALVSAPAPASDIYIILIILIIFAVVSVVVMDGRRYVLFIASSAM